MEGLFMLAEIHSSHDWQQHAMHDAAAAHAFLDLAKKRDWTKVIDCAGRNPELINAQPSGRFSALHQAAEANNEEVVGFLLEHRADVNAKTASGQLAADLAKDPKVRTLLHHRHAELGKRHELEHAFLDLAKVRKWKEVQEMLRETPSLARAQPAGRWSALHQAASAGCEDVVAQLLGSRADPKAKTSCGKTVLEVATGSVRHLLFDKTPIVIGSDEEAPSKRQKVGLSVPAPAIIKKEGYFELSSPGGVLKGSYTFDHASAHIHSGGAAVGVFSSEPVGERPFLPSLLATQGPSALIPQVTVVSGEIMEEIQKPSNEGAFFVLPSQLNGAEYPMHNYVVEQINKYKYDKTGGPRGQLAVHPAVGQFILDNAACDTRPKGLDATDLLLAKAKASPAWPKGYNLHVRNGYMAVPYCSKDDQAGLLQVLREQLHWLRCLCAQEVPCSGLRPDLQNLSTAKHKVNMVYASAIPVKAYLNAGNLDVAFQEEVGRLVIAAQYFGALRLAALGSKPGTRRIFLMPLGGGVFNNRAELIVGALATALELLALELGREVFARLDIRLLAFRGSAGEQERMSKLLAALVPASSSSTAAASKTPSVPSWPAAPPAAPPAALPAAPPAAAPDAAPAAAPAAPLESTEGLPASVPSASFAPAAEPAAAADAAARPWQLKGRSTSLLDALLDDD
ncbi:unnamed protein product [Effrenium voratum]|nr:unnamed protein product [Effrenium voratum]